MTIGVGRAGIRQAIAKPQWRENAKLRQALHLTL